MAAHSAAHSTALLTALLSAALLALWLAQLGQAPLFDADEGAFAEASREMLSSGDWGHTTLNGADRWDKPILVYWLQAASMAVFGVHEFAARLPSALCAWAWCMATAGFVAPRWGRPAAFVAAAMLATSLGPLVIGRAATADALLNLLLALSLFDLWRALQDPQDRAPRRRAFVWIGLGILAKGPVAVLLPGAALLLWAGLAPRGQGSSQALRALLSDPWAWAVGLGAALPWYAYALARHGQAFVQGFFVRHNLERFSGPMEGHSGSLVYYLIALPLLFLPWTPWLWAALRNLRAAWADASTRWLLAWAGFVVVFFSLSGTKLPHYGLYAVTALVVLACRHAAEAPRALLAATGLCAALPWAAACLSPQLAQWLATRSADPRWLALISSLGSSTAVPAPALLLGSVVLLLAALAAAFARHSSLRLGGAAVAALVATLGWTQFALPWWATALQGPVRTLAQQARQEGWTLVQWQAHQPSAGFYAGEPVVQREPKPGEAALMLTSRFEALSAAERASLQLVRSERGYALVRRRPDALAPPR